MTPTRPMAPVQARNRRSRDRLESWKEIASYLHRSVRTARRWELHEGLPVRRHQHRKRGSIYAYRVELDDWRTSREKDRSRTTGHPGPVLVPAVPAAPAARKQPEPVSKVSLEDILTSCSDLICVFDRSSRYLLSSKAGAKALGLDRDEMIGRDWRELGLPAEAMAPFHRHVAEVLARGRSIRTEVSYPTLVGHQTYEYILDPIRSGNGDEVTSVLAIVRAIHNGRNR